MHLIIYLYVWSILYDRVTDHLPNYSGREALSHGLVFFFFVFFQCCDFALWTLIGSRPDDTFFVVCRSRVSESTLGRKMSTSDACFACPSSALRNVCWDAHITYERIGRLR